MNKEEVAFFLFSIAKEIEQSFQCPIIFFMEKDYAEVIFNSLMELRKALERNATPNELIEIVRNFHLKWLESVNNIELFKKRLKDVPREVVFSAIEFTIECLENRNESINNYIKDMDSSMTNEEKQLMNENLDIIEEIKQINLSALLEKKKEIIILADQNEYLNKINDEIEELLNWLDAINDDLALHFSKLLDLKVPLLPSDLTKTLKQIVEEVAGNPNPETQRIADLIQSKSKVISRTVRVNSLRELEMTKIVQKIKDLEDRVSRLQNQNSSALMALRHKTLYLEDRLDSLENFKLSLIRLKTSNVEDERIFNHILPHKERERLVERLVKLWESAIAGHDHDSIISILSVADLKEVFHDLKGRFSVDKYGRKIYYKNNDQKLYQLNEYNELVPVNDDDKHIYFYDECGRYYLNSNKLRVYKAREDSSEYLLNKTGLLFKIKEVKNGMEYFYDWLGRYRINKYGKKVYCDENSINEYEDDGLGNLVKIGSREYYNEDTICKRPLSIEENRYLQKVVGPALKKCIANVILHQPCDPIAFLAMCLVEYRENKEERQRRLDLEQEMLEERAMYSPTKENTPTTYLKDYTMDYTYESEVGEGSIFLY